MLFLSGNLSLSPAPAQNIAYLFAERAILETTCVSVCFVDGSTHFVIGFSPLRVNILGCHKLAQVAPLGLGFALTQSVVPALKSQGGAE